MSKALKCDRCGTFYEPYVKKQSNGSKATCIEFLVETYGCESYNTIEYDLCQKCMKELLDSMNLDEKGEKRQK